jgi:tetratricopeptide (TPR) repeat protein
VHRSLYEEAFASAEFPDVPHIDEFVVNWNALSERHKKRVALSIAPWSRFLPVLIEGGATYYIKPLYELLSETPGQENLRDLRISSDARLWDDVRGCGGYNSVTGVEDVERTIFYRYDTVVHELTHQVHGVLPTARDRQLRELYRRTKERDLKTADAFLSRYAGSNVWEYFAEGANALISPRRDEYDTREIVRERLDEYDPALVRLVEDLMQEADVESCYAVAYVNLGYKSIERGQPLEAIPIFHKALERSSGEENALGALVYSLLLADSTQSALAVSQEAIELHPENGDLATGHANAMWHAGHPLAEALDFLDAAHGRVREDERYRVDLAMGRYHWILGAATEAKKAYQAALEKRPEYPPALAGLAAAEALAGDRDEAWETYDRAIRLRSGASDLREAFARDLLLAGEKERAKVQLGESLLLDPENPRALALKAWMALTEEQPDSARAIASSVLETSPWCDLALLIKAQAERAQGDSDLAEATLRPWKERVDRRSPPDYVYLDRWGRYEEVHTLPAVERRVMLEHLGGSGR